MTLRYIGEASCMSRDGNLCLALWIVQPRGWSSDWPTHLDIRSTQAFWICQSLVVYLQRCLDKRSVVISFEEGY